MHIEIPRKNQIRIIIAFVVVAVLITLIVLLGERMYMVDNNISDNERFYMEYNSVPIDNIFKYVTIQETIELLNSEQAVIFIGFKECKWCQSYAPILNDVIKQSGIDTIYYLNIKDDRSKNTDGYKQLVEILKDYLYDDENGNKRIYVPDVYFVIDGKIVGHNNDTSTIPGADTEEYYTKETVEELNNKLKDLALKVYESKYECDDTGKGC